MNFNKHYNLEGRHAFLGASKYNWINYDPEKLDATYLKALATERGTRLHELAAELIELGVKLPKSPKTLNMYVNDAIGYRMTPEQILYYSDNCFGTTDAISFKKNVLRIHDLKTGETKTHIEQLEIYAALFCLEYGVSPDEIQIELRIYQNDQVFVENPDPEIIFRIMDTIVEFDKRIERLKMEG